MHTHTSLRQGVLTLIMGSTLLVLVGCTGLKTLRSDTLPQLGWSTAQVEAALGPSVQITAGINPPVAMWHYGVERTMGVGPMLVLPRCDHLSRSCLLVLFREGRVVDVRMTRF